MPSVADVLAYLWAEGLAPAHQDDGRARTAPLTGVASIEMAGVGHVSWCSERAFRRAPEYVASFAGTLLLAPSAVPDSMTGPTVVRCHDPKLAFILVYERFFAGADAGEWIDEAPGSVAPDAQLAEDVVLGRGVVVGPGCEIKAGCSIGPHAYLSHVSLGTNCQVGPGAVIGLPGFGFERDAAGRTHRFPHLGRVIVGDDVHIGANVCIDRGALGDTRVGHGVQVDALSQVAHNVVIGDRTVICGRVAIAGSVVIGADSWIAPGVTILNQVELGERAFVGIGSVVVRSVAPDTRVFGNPAKLVGRSK